MRLYLVNTTNPKEAILQKVIPLLPNNSQIKILKNRLLVDQWRATLSDLLLRKILAHELAISFDSVKIEVDSYGKPFLKGGKRHFNLSHARDLIILATDNDHIGVDVECIRPFDELDHLLTQFSQEEKKLYQAQPKEQRIDFFYDLWTLKESYLKALGKGLSCSLDSFNIRVSDKEAQLSLGIDSDVSWHFKRYTFGTQYKCSVCARRNQFPENVSIIDVENLFGLYN
jgi:4'-phosphopantetheinyl transferase